MTNSIGNLQMTRYPINKQDGVENFDLKIQKPEVFKLFIYPLKLPMYVTLDVVSGLRV